MGASRQLRVADPLWRYLRDNSAKVLRFDGADPSWLGVPVVFDVDLTGGQWQLRESDGGPETSGDMAPAPEGMVADYSEVFGWYARPADIDGWWLPADPPSTKVRAP